jgi:hypothetical protein
MPGRCGRSWWGLLGDIPDPFLEERTYRLWLFLSRCYHSNVLFIRIHRLPYLLPGPNRSFLSLLSLACRGGKVEDLYSSTGN